MKKLKVIIWDFDGVIVDSRELALELTQKLYEGVTEGLHRVLHLGNIFVGLSKLKRKNISDNEEKDFLENSYWPRKTQLPLIKDMTEVIQELSKEYIMVINSSSWESFITKYLKKYNLLHSFYKIYGKETSKSKEEKFKLILKELDVNANECVLITDTVGDVLEALLVDIKSIGVLWGYQQENHFASLENKIILVKESADLINIVKELS